MKQIRMNAISEAIINSRSLINVIYGNIGDVSTDRTPFREFLSSICKKQYEFVETVDAVHLSCEDNTDVYDKYRARDEMILNLSAMKQKMKESSSFCLIVDLSCAPDGHEKECFLRGVFKLVDDIGNNRLIIICRKEDIDYLNQLKDLFESSRGKFYFVELYADVNTRLERNVTPHRLESKLSKQNVEWSNNELVKSMEKYRLSSNEDEFIFDTHYKIDNTNLSPEEVANMIVEKYNLSI